MAKRWYVVHVYSGFEKKIAEQVKEQAARKGLADMVDDVLVPSEEVVELNPDAFEFVDLVPTLAAAARSLSKGCLA